VRAEFKRSLAPHQPHISSGEVFAVGDAKMDSITDGLLNYEAENNNLLCSPLAYRDTKKERPASRR
jgi:hypothetical protein